MFYSSSRPKKTLLLDSLPGEMYLDNQGNVRIGSYLSVAVSLGAIASVFAFLYYVLVKMSESVS